MASNPKCPHCHSPSKKNGSSRGTQQYRCKKCDRSFTGKRRGRPIAGEKRLTRAEINARYRAKKAGKPN